MNIYVVKLMTGEEIIGISEVKLEADPEYINLTDVYSVETQYSPDNQIAGTFFNTFMVYVQENELFTFPRRSVILYSVPSLSLIEYYLEFLDRTKAAREQFNKKNTKILQ